MKANRLLLLTSAGALLVMAHTRQAGQVEAADGDMGTISTDQITDTIMATINSLTETPANVDAATAARNLRAALDVLQRAEGTAGNPDPYRVCFGYRHTINSLSEHPAITGEWRGEVLSDAMCANAGFGPGCKSTAAGAYQLIKPTWQRARDALGLRDFSAASQDAAAAWIIQKQGALQDVYAGRVTSWVNKCRSQWASLPGNYAKQGQRSMATLVAWYQQAGGTQA